MWHTTYGERKLIGKEARLFKEGALFYVDQIFDFEEEGSHMGVPAYDSLTKENRSLILLSTIEAALGDKPSPDLYAWNEGAIYCVFQSIKVSLEMEIWNTKEAARLGRDKQTFYSWRKLVHDAYLERLAEDGAQEYKEHTMESDDFEIWEEKVERLVDSILPDRDFISCESIMDVPPSRAAIFKQILRIEDDYAVIPPPVFAPKEQQRLMDLRYKWNTTKLHKSQN